MSVTVNKTRLPGSVIKTASGAVASVSDARMRGAIGVEASFEPRQDLHGYSYPWVAGAGKNLLPFEDVFSDGWTNTVNGLTATYNNGYMKVTGTNTSTGWTNVVYIEPWISHTIDLGAGNYTMSEHLTIRCKVDGGGSFVNKSTTFTANSSVSIRGFYIAVTGSTTVDWNIPMMLIRGTSRPTTYEPYENLCPISGIASASAWADPQYAGLVDWNQLFPAAEDWYAQSVQSRVVVDDDGVITATIMSGGPSVYAPAIRTATYPAVVANHIYYFACKFKPATDGYPYVRNNSGVTVAAFGGQTTPGGTWGNYERIVGATGDADLYYFGQGGNTSQIQVGDSISFKDLICVDLTRVYGAGNEPQTVNEFRTRFPKDYYAYNPGEMMTVSAVNGDPHNVTAQLGETRYGGTYDFVRGKLTLTMAYDQMTSAFLANAKQSGYIGATTTGGENVIWVRNWNYQTAAPRRSGGIDCVCNAFRVSMHNTTIMSSQNRTYFWTGSMTSVDEFIQSVQKLEQNGNGLYLCYELATPIVIDMTPAEFELFHRNNFVWSDVGDTTLTYAAIHEHGG